jgi:hypothetical protein
MYYNHEEGKLIQGQYQKNILIGLEWLETFTTANDWKWSSNEEVTTIRDGLYVEDLKLREILAGTNIIRGTKVILSDLVAWLLDPRQKLYRDAWAADLGPDIDVATQTVPGTRKRKRPQQAP